MESGISRFQLSVRPSNNQSMKLNKLSTFALLVTVAASSVWAAPIQWSVASGGNGHFYEAFVADTTITWNQALTAAQSKGGYLATLTSAAENNFVFSLVDNPIYWTDAGGNSAGPWLGGFQPGGSVEPAGGWQWLNQEGPFVFSNWSTDAPNGADEDSLMFWGPFPITRSNGWNDGPAAFLNRAYVVEYVPEPTSAALLLFGLALASLVRRKIT